MGLSNNSDSMECQDEPPDEEAYLLATQNSVHSLYVETPVKGSVIAMPRKLSTSKGKSAWWPRLPRVQWSWDLLAISLVYVVEGFTDLAGTAVSYYSKDNLGLGPAEAGLITTIGLIPWNMTPLLGLMTDSVSICGYHRKAYLMLIGVAGSLSWLLLPKAVTVLPVACLVFLGNACSAWSQVVSDAVTVKLSQGQTMDVAAFLQSLSWITYTFGAVIGGLSAGRLLESNGPKPVFIAMSILMLIVSACAFLISESKETGNTQSNQGYSKVGTTPVTEEADIEGLTDNTPALANPCYRPVFSNSQQSANNAKKDSFKSVLWQKVLPAIQKTKHLLGLVWDTIKQPHIRGCALFIFVWQSTPAPTSAMFYFQTNVLGLQPHFMELMWLTGSLAGFTGVLIYNLFLVRCELRWVLCCGALAGTLLNASQLLLVSRLNLKLGLSDEFFSLGDYSLLSVLAEVMLTPMLALAARVCPEGVEATLAATLYSLLNLSQVLSAASGAGLTAIFGVTQTDFSHLFPLTLLCNLLLLLPLPLLMLVPRGCGHTPDPDGHTDQQIEDEMEKNDCKDDCDEFPEYHTADTSTSHSFACMIGARASLTDRLDQAAVLEGAVQLDIPESDNSAFQAEID